MTKVLSDRQNSRENRVLADTKNKIKSVGKNTAQSPRMSTMMNIKEKGRFSPG